MPRYKFTHFFAEVFSDLVHGAGTIVHRVEEVVDPEGSTVVLQPGDELTTKQPYEHAHLEEVNAKPDPLPKPDLAVAPVVTDSKE
jgi:folate-dependent phosphoribosylglycinamide formyltransferase PurN